MSGIACDRGENSSLLFEECGCDESIVVKRFHNRIIRFIHSERFEIPIVIRSHFRELPIEFLFALRFSPFKVIIERGSCAATLTKLQVNASLCAVLLSDCVHLNQLHKLTSLVSSSASQFRKSLVRFVPYDPLGDRSWLGMHHCYEKSWGAMCYEWGLVWIKCRHIPGIALKRFYWAPAQT